MMKIVYWVLIWIFFINTSLGLKMTNLTMPRVVEQGRTIDISCEFEYTEEEREELDVKWYFRDSRVPFLQWVPSTGRQPHVLVDRFKGKVDLTLRYLDKGKGVYQRRQTLRLLSPTTIFSGDYTCKVSTFTVEEMKVRRLLVYDPPEEILFDYTFPPGLVNITCSANKIFPQPVIDLRLGLRPYNEEATQTMSRDGIHFDISMSKVVSTSMLPSSRLLTCSLTISNTPYSVTREIVFIPPERILAVRSSATEISFLRNFLTFLTFTILAAF